MTETGTGVRPPGRTRDGDGLGGLLAGTATFEELRDHAVALRRQGLSRRQIRDRLKVGNNDLLNRLVEGEPAPEWTRRPNAKDDLRAKARELRLAGATYDRIQAELGVSKSSISLWVRDLPRPVPKGTASQRAKDAARKRWDHELAVRDADRQRTKAAAAEQVGQLSDRELMLVGTALYWAEGAKSKSYRTHERAIFINSDAGMIQVYLRWLALLEVEPENITFRVMIHESADVAGAEAYWADLVGIEVAQLKKTTLKKHNPQTVRKNVGDDYRGCLVVAVNQSADLYRRIEGWWCGIVLGSKQLGDD